MTKTLRSEHLIMSLWSWHIIMFIESKKVTCLKWMLKFWYFIPFPSIKEWQAWAATRKKVQTYITPPTTHHPPPPPPTRTDLSSPAGLPRDWILEICRTTCGKRPFHIIYIENHWRGCEGPKLIITKAIVLLHPMQLVPYVFLSFFLFPHL